MKNESKGRNQVVGEVCYLEFIGHDFVKSALVLLENNNEQGGSSTHWNTINLLASQALELLPKSLIAIRICLKKNNKSLEEIHGAINKKLTHLGHKLDDIFKEVPELKTALNIVKIKRINSKVNKDGKVKKDVIIDEFHFTVKNDFGNKNIIRIKNLEAARYGLFAQNPDIGGNFVGDMENIVNFVKKLSEETNKIRASMITEFDKNIKK